MREHCEIVKSNATQMKIGSMYLFVDWSTSFVCSIVKISKGAFTNYVNKILGVFDPYPPPGCSHLLLNVNNFLRFLTPTLPLAVHIVCEWPLYTLFVFEIFKITQKTKKLALSSYPLGSSRSSQGCLCVPRHAQCGSVRSHKKFFQPQYI